MEKRNIGGERLTEEDLLTEVLSRLDVKSLLRSKAVSKTWCSLISSPCFIKSHYQRAIASCCKHDETLIVRRYVEEDEENKLQFSLLQLNSGQNVLPDLRFPYSQGPSKINYIHKLASKRPMYKSIDCNSDLDVYTKIALLKVSPSVVGLVSYSGDEEINQGSGTIIESDHNENIVLTSANLIRCIRRPTCEQFVENNLLENLKVTVYTCDGTGYKGEVSAHDFHYNLAAIRFKSETPLATAALAHVDDSVSIASVPQSFQAFSFVHIQDHLTLFLVIK